MKAVRTSETSAYFNDITQRFIPESCNLLSRCRDEMKPHNSDLSAPF
jgi:hypothetical protein